MKKKTLLAILLLSSTAHADIHGRLACFMYKYAETEGAPAQILAVGSAILRGDRSVSNRFTLTNGSNETSVLFIQNGSMFSDDYKSSLDDPNNNILSITVEDKTSNWASTNNIRCEQSQIATNSYLSGFRLSDDPNNHAELAAKCRILEDTSDEAYKKYVGSIHN